MEVMIDALWQRFEQGDRRALSRLLTWATNGTCRDELSARLQSTRSTATPSPAISNASANPVVSGAPVVAITGSGGVGKSTLLGGLLAWWQGRRQRVAVLACDPESPLTGGALLGDRVRMASTTDEGIFIRSVPVPSGQQAVAECLPQLIELLRVFGRFDRIMLETAGAGQGDIAVRQLADLLVLVVQPQAGDQLQWEKAGLLELADLVVVHKADLPGADLVVAQLHDQFNWPGARVVPVLAVSSLRRQGLEALGLAIEQALAQLALVPGAGNKSSATPTAR